MIEPDLTEIVGAETGKREVPTGEMPGFPTTRWSLVQAAVADGTLATETLESLCEDYWYPLYVFARRSGCSRHDAQDATQGFFERLLSGDSFARADQAKGRLRSYLLGGMKHFMASEWRKARAAKRGGGERVLPLFLDGEVGESRMQFEPEDEVGLSPDAAFDRRWALQLLDRVLQRLRSEQPMKANLKFELLARCLAGDSDARGYSDLGAELEMSEGAVKVAVHRLRRRYAQILREEIAHTVSSDGEIEDELDALLAALR